MHLNKKNFQRHKAAEKIQLLLRRNNAMTKREKLLLEVSKNWLLNGNKNMTRNFAATTIQRHWRIYKKGQIKHNLIKQDPEMIINECLLKSNICHVCRTNKVSYICKDCSNMNFCHIDFERYHLRGTFKNHEYLLVEKSNINTSTNSKYVISHISASVLKLKDYLIKNMISLYDHFKLWDFQHNGQIKLKHLKDSMSLKFFNFTEEMRDAVIRLAYKYVIESKSNFEESVIRYEDLCLELFN